MFFVLLATCLLMLIFWVPPVKISNILENKYELNLDEKVQYHLSSLQTDFFKKQYDEATKEIAENGATITKWFEYKFFVVGSLLAALIFNLYFIDKKSPDTDHKLQPRDKMYEIITSPTFCLILGLALVLCISIDMQIRDKAMGSIQRGLWLRHFIEPILNYGKIKDGQIRPFKQMIGWEEFYRAGSKSYEEGDSADSSNTNKSTVGNNNKERLKESNSQNLQKESRIAEKGSSKLAAKNDEKDIERKVLIRLFHIEKNPKNFPYEVSKFLPRHFLTFLAYAVFLLIIQLCLVN